MNEQISTENETDNATPTHIEYSTNSNGHLESQPNFNIINEGIQTANNAQLRINGELQKIQHLPAIQYGSEIMDLLRSLNNGQISMASEIQLTKEISKATYITILILFRIT